jgi:hypothetical protein
VTLKALRRIGLGVAILAAIAGGTWLVFSRQLSSAATSSGEPGVSETASANREPRSEMSPDVHPRSIELSIRPRPWIDDRGSTWRAAVVSPDGRHHVSDPFSSDTVKMSVPIDAHQAARKWSVLVGYRPRVGLFRLFRSEFSQRAVTSPELCLDVSTASTCTVNGVIRNKSSAGRAASVIRCALSAWDEASPEFRLVPIMLGGTNEFRIQADDDGRFVLPARRFTVSCG